MNSLKNLFYGNGTIAFSKAVAPRQIYEKKGLLNKLGKHFFFHRMAVEVKPSYHFGTPEEHYFPLFPQGSELGEASEKKDFLVEPHVFLKNCIFDSLVSGNALPQILRDFSQFYPKFGLTFGEEEFVYLDFGIQLPKVFDSLLGELLIHDTPFCEPFVELSGYTLNATIIVYPPLKVKALSREDLHKHILEYLAGEEPEKYFYQVIKLYLESRLTIKHECIKELEIKGLEVNDNSLVEYFLGYYIFKEVSLAALQFCVANSDIQNANPFKFFREHELKKWNIMSVKERQHVIYKAKLSLANREKEAAHNASLTHEEKVTSYVSALKAMDENFKNMKVALIPVNELFPFKK